MTDTKVTHDFKWIMDKEATETERGTKHEECTVCGSKKAAVEIPATGAETGSPEPAKPTESPRRRTKSRTTRPYPRPATTETMPLWSSVFAAASAALAATTVLQLEEKI